MFLLASLAGNDFVHGALLASAWTLLAVVLLFAGVKLADLFERKIDFTQEILKGNIAAALLLGSFVIAIAYLVGVTIS